MKHNVILIGYMGSGKSTIGKKLSFREKKAFLDTDRMIEQKQKKSVAEIFDALGEGAFRDMETACLREILALKDDYVISTGGGLPLRGENRRLLGQLGTVVYLRARPETIYERLKGDTTRPLLRGEDPQGKIAAMIAERAPLYEAAADGIVDVDNKRYEEILAEIAALEKEEET